MPSFTLLLRRKFVFLSLIVFTLSSCIDEPEQMVTTPLHNNPASEWVATDSTSHHASQDELTELAEATKFYPLNVRNPTTPQTIQLSVPDGLYLKNAPSDGGRIYASMEIDVWNAYSLKERRNYYLLHFETVTNFSSAYTGVTNTTNNGLVCKVCSVYGREIEVSVNGTYPEMTIHTHAPTTTEGATQYSTSVQFSLGGVVGVKGGDPDIEARPSISISKSESYSIADITVRDRCNGAKPLDWIFELSDAEISYSFFSHAQTEIRPGALAGRESMTARANAIVSFPDTGRPPKIMLYYRVKLKELAGSFGTTYRNNTDDLKQENMWITLPYINFEQAKDAAERMPK